MKRRGARKLALDVLYEQGVTGSDYGQVLSRYSQNPAFEYASHLVNGVAEHLDEIDGKLAEYAEDWALDRMPQVDLNLLRIAAYELLYEHDVPAAAAITEAMELAKTYSTEDSSRFINGVLGKIAAEHPR